MLLGLSEVSNEVKMIKELIFLVSAAVFQPELNNLQKRPNYATSVMFFEVYSIMTEKQRLKPKNSNSQ